MFDIEAREEYLRVYHRIHYQKNKESITVIHNEYNKNNREKNNLRSKEWYKCNKDKIAIRTKQWRKDNVEKMAELTKRWREQNPDKWCEYSHIRRAKIKEVTFEKFSINDIYQRDNWICQICKRAVNKKLKYPDPLSKSLDHIVPLSHGGNHTRENVQLAHLKCNCSIGIGGIKQLLMFG